MSSTSIEVFSFHGAHRNNVSDLRKTFDPTNGNPIANTIVIMIIAIINRTASRFSLTFTPKERSRSRSGTGNLAFERWLNADLLHLYIGADMRFLLSKLFLDLDVSQSLR